MKKTVVAMCLLFLASLLSGCSAEPSSESWCKDMKDKSQSEWTMQEAGTFTKHCVLGNYKE
ncbi:MAG: DUF3012 domain-containing protein [Proteobacteria bacterium]|nr:MAG: DUF3012 domain-containing protein [Pseudomonadota bacterium]